MKERKGFKNDFYCGSLKQKTDYPWLIELVNCLIYRPVFYDNLPPEYLQWCRKTIALQIF